VMSGAWYEGAGRRDGNTGDYQFDRDLVTHDDRTFFGPGDHHTGICGGHLFFWCGLGGFFCRRGITTG